MIFINRYLPYSSHHFFLLSFQCEHIKVVHSFKDDDCVAVEMYSRNKHKIDFDSSNFADIKVISRFSVEDANANVIHIRYSVEIVNTVMKIKYTLNKSARISFSKLWPFYKLSNVVISSMNRDETKIKFNKKWNNDCENCC